LRQKLYLDFFDFANFFYANEWVNRRRIFSPHLTPTPVRLHDMVTEHSNLLNLCIDKTYQRNLVGIDSSRLLAFICTILYSSLSQLFRAARRASTGQSNYWYRYLAKATCICTIYSKVRETGATCLPIVGTTAETRLCRLRKPLVPSINYNLSVVQLRVLR